MSLRDWWWRPERGFGFEEADNGGPSATGGCYTWLDYIELKILGRSAFDSAPGEPRSVRPATQSSPAGFLCGVRRKFAHFGPNLYLSRHQRQASSTGCKNQVPYRP